jgi:hypothetical protein
VSVRTIWIVGGLLAILMLAGCTAASSSEGSDASFSSPAISPSASPGASAQALEAAARAYSAAYLSGNADAAWRFLSGRCQSRLGRTQFDAVVTIAHTTYADARFQTFKVDQLSGSLARVTYTFDSHELDQSQEPWVFEDGAWRDDDC